MMRIVVIADTGPCRAFRQRCENLAVAAFPEARVFLKVTEEACRLAIGADLVIVHHNLSRESLSLLEYLRAADVPIIFDASPDLNWEFGADADIIRTIIRAANVVVCSSQGFAPKLRAQHPNVEILNDYSLSADLVDVAADALSLGIVLETCKPNPALIDILSKAVEELKCNIVFFGPSDLQGRLFAEKFPGQVHFRGKIGHDEASLLAEIRESRINAGLVLSDPTAPEPQSSKIDFLRFSALGIPCAAARSGFHDFELKIGGISSFDGLNGLFHVLQQLVDPSLRAALGRKARDFVRSHHSLDRLASEYRQIDGDARPQRNYCAYNQEQSATSGFGLFWTEDRLYLDSRKSLHHVTSLDVVPSLLASGYKLINRDWPPPCYKRLERDLSRSPEIASFGLSLGTRKYAERFPDKAIGSSSLRIGWLLPDLGKHTNLVKEIVRIASALEDLGHECRLYLCDTAGSPVPETEGALTNFKGWISNIDETLASCDLLCATHWTTVGISVCLQGKSPAVIRYIHEFEPDNYPIGSEFVLAEATYRSGLYAMTPSAWCAHVLRVRYGMMIDHIPLPIDRGSFKLHVGTRRAKRLVFYADPTDLKWLYDLGVKALRAVAHLRPEIEIVFFGSEALQGCIYDFAVTNLGLLPDPLERAKLFGGSTCGMVLSPPNPGGILYEMMACGLPIIDVDRDLKELNYGNRFDIAALLNCDPPAMATQIVALLDDDSDLERRRRNGLEFTMGLSSPESFAQNLAQKLAERCTPRALKTGAKVAHPNSAY